MRSLARPTISSAEVFTICVTGVRDRKNQFDAVRPDIAKADKKYRETAEIGAFGTMKSADFTVQADMQWLYTKRLAEQGSPGRHIYDEIRSLSDMCPLCGYGKVKTLDHYLPKESYNALAVNVANLIPACGDCNHNKGRKTDPVLHPYYDDLQEQWLRAKVVEGPGGGQPVVEYLPCPPGHWPTGLADRVRNHFRILELGRLYPDLARNEMGCMTIALKNLHHESSRLGRSGSAAVRRHLTGMAEGTRKWEGANHWKTIMYDALAASDWYCDHGFDF